MMPDLYIPTYTINDWKLWEGYWELIKGHAVSLGPPPLVKHQLMSGGFHYCLALELKRKKAHKRNKILYNTDWIINETTVVRPDIAVVCGEINPNGHIESTPALIIEISSKSTQLKDRNTKFNLYEFCGVKYYLMADPDTQSVEVFALIDNKYKQIHQPFSFTINEACIIDFDLKQALEG